MLIIPILLILQLIVICIVSLHLSQRLNSDQGSLIFVLLVMEMWVPNKNYSYLDDKTNMVGEVPTSKQSLFQEPL